MFRISPIRTLTLLALLSLGGGAMADATPRPAAPRTAAGAWTFETSMWSFLAAFLQKSGYSCTFDPFGCESRPRAAVTETDAGCGIDPYGRCENRPPTATTATDEGCTIDPEGHCKR